MLLLTLEGICKQKIIESVPYNEIKKLSKFLQIKVLIINKIFLFDDILFISKYKQSLHVYDNYFKEGTEEHILINTKMILMIVIDIIFMMIILLIMVMMIGYFIYYKIKIIHKV